MTWMPRPSVRAPLPPMLRPYEPARDPSTKGPSAPMCERLIFHGDSAGTPLGCMPHPADPTSCVWCGSPLSSPGAGPSSSLPALPSDDERAVPPAPGTGTP